MYVLIINMPVFCWRIYFTSLKPTGWSGPSPPSTLKPKPDSWFLLMNTSSSLVLAAVGSDRQWRRQGQHWQLFSPCSNWILSQTLVIIGFNNKKGCRSIHKMAILIWYSIENVCAPLVKCVYMICWFFKTNNLCTIAADLLNLTF